MFTKDASEPYTAVSSCRIRNHVIIWNWNRKMYDGLENETEYVNIERRQLPREGTY